MSAKTATTLNILSNDVRTDALRAVRQRLPLVLAGNTIIRIAGGAGGVLIGLYFSDLGNRGQDVNAMVVGLLGAVTYGAELIGALPMGVLTDRLSPRFLMIAGGLLGATGMGLLGVVRQVPAFFVSRSLEGGAWAASATSILVYLTDLTEDAKHIRGRVMAIFEVTLLTGIALGGPVGAGLWRRLGTTAFVTTAGLYLLSSVAFWIGARGSEKRSTEEAFAGLKQAFNEPSIRTLAPAWLAINAIVGIWMGPMITFLLTFRQEGSQYLNGLFADNPEQVGWVFLAYTLVFGLGVTIWSSFIDRLDRKTVLSTCLAATLVVCGALYLVNHMPDLGPGSRMGLLVFLALALMVESGFTPAALALLADIVGGVAGRGAAMGIYSALLGIGALMGALIASFLGAQFGIDGLIHGTVALVVVALMTIRRLPAEVRLDRITSSTRTTNGGRTWTGRGRRPTIQPRGTVEGYQPRRTYDLCPVQNLPYDRTFALWTDVSVSLPQVRSV